MKNRSEKPRKKPKYTVLKAIGVIFAVFAVLAVISFPLKTVEYKFYTDKTDAPVRIAQISDLHSCKYGKDMSGLINAVDNTQPDIVVLTGDIYDDEVDNCNTRTFLKDISKKYPCFYIPGNHERRSGKWEEFRLEAESYGITVLEGENVNIKGICICGASGLEKERTFDGSVQKCADEASKENYNVLLAHYPTIEKYRCGKFDLILSGHAHGGHWRIPYLMNGFYTPDEGFFPKYAGGRYDFEDCTMIVSRGLSRTKNIIPRIFNNPELVIVDILPYEETQ